MGHCNPYAPTSNHVAPIKIRLAIIPATVVVFAGLVVVFISIGHFGNNVFPEIKRVVANNHFAHALGCVLGTTSLLCSAASFFVAAREWLRLRFGPALHLTFFMPTLLILMAFFFFYCFG